VYTTREPKLTLIFHDRRAVANTGLRLARSTGHASVEWVMGRRPTVLREATKVGHEIVIFGVTVSATTNTTAKRLQLSMGLCV